MNYPSTLSTPEININFEKHGQQYDAMDSLSNNIDFPDASVNTIDGFRVDYEDCWGLVRPSNTTPCLVLRFEGKEKLNSTKYKKDLKNGLRERYSSREFIVGNSKKIGIKYEFFILEQILPVQFNFFGV